MRFSRVAASVFAVVSLAHFYRAWQQIPLQLATTAIPVWVSWVGATGAGLLCLWGFRTQR